MVAVAEIGAVRRTDEATTELVRVSPATVTARFNLGVKRSP